MSVKNGPASHVFGGRGRGRWEVGRIRQEKTVGSSAFLNRGGPAHKRGHFITRIHQLTINHAILPFCVNISQKKTIMIKWADSVSHKLTMQNMRKL